MGIRLGEEEHLKGKDVLYILEDYTQEIGINDNKLIMFANNKLNINEDLTNVVDFFKDKKALKVAKAIQHCTSDEVFDLILEAFGKEFTDKFEVYYDNFLDTAVINFDKIKYIK